MFQTRNAFRKDLLTEVNRDPALLDESQVLRRECLPLESLKIYGFPILHVAVMRKRGRTIRFK